MTNQTVSIIIPTFNGLDLLKQNLPAVLKAQGNKSNKIKEIIIVDDGSTDGTDLFIKENYSQVKFLKHKKNRGVSSSINTGVRFSKGQLVVLLNNDVKPEYDFLESISPLFENPKIFGVSLHEKGFGWAKGKFVDGFIIHEGVREDNKLHETFWISGGSGVFNRKYFLKLGGMDEKLFSPFYWEDLDISYRAMKRGYKLYWHPKGNVVHQHESTVKRLNKKFVNRIQERNHILFIWKNLTSKSLFKKHLISLAKRILKHPGYLQIFFLALARLPEVLRKRKKEEKESAISDEAIFAKFS